MLTHCPHCRQALQLTTDQVAKLEQALARLEPGKTLAVKCPRCRGAITLDKPAPAAGPDTARLQPPPPPNLDWLETGVYQGEEKVEDVPMALVLHQPDERQARIGEALETVGYQVLLVDSVADALERMRFVNFSCIVLQAELEETLARSFFHAHMRRLPMERRRYIFYIVIGDGFHTLYNLEALALSANLVVNSADLVHLDVILRKAIPAYEELFGPILEELNAYGKR